MKSKRKNIAPTVAAGYSNHSNGNGNGNNSNLSVSIDNNKNSCNLCMWQTGKYDCNPSVQSLSSFLLRKYVAPIEKIACENNKFHLF